MEGSDEAKSKSTAPDSDVAITTVLAATVDADTGQCARLGGEFAGYIFMCNATTKPDCFTYRVFGLPASRVDDVEKIKPNAKLFLFDFEVKLLYGPYVADSVGKLSLEPYAFGGRFPAQVKFSIAKDCLPLPEAAFKDAIKDNYVSKSKFKQDLSYEQVDKLVSLFRPINLQSPHQASTTFHTAAHHESSMPAIVQTLHRSIPAYEPSAVFQHPSHLYVPEKPFLPLHSTHNQTVVSRGGVFASDPHLTQIDYDRYGSTRVHQAYHPDYPSFQRPDTHSGYGYIPQQGINTAVPPVPPTNQHYALNLPYGSNYLSTHGAVAVPTAQPVHAYKSHLASTSSYYAPSESNPAMPHTSQPGSSEAGAIDAYSYYRSIYRTEPSHGTEYQPYSGSQLTQPVIHQEVHHAYGNQEHPNSHVSIPEGSADSGSYGYQNQGYSGYYHIAPVSSEQVTNTGQSQVLPQTVLSGSGVAVPSAYSYYNQGY